MPKFPHHAALDLLLQQQQFDACRMVAEKMIEDLMAPLTIEPGIPAETLIQQWQSRDLELAQLHLTLSRCLLGLSEYEIAATTADAAALLARKAADTDTHAEALHIAGACHGQAGNLSTAAQRFSECLQHASGGLRARALYNRGHVYERQGAYAYAVPDFESALELADGIDPKIARSTMINLAWDLIMLREFQRAEELLERLAAVPDADDDDLLRAQIAHDKLHMAYLQGHHREALRQMFLALRETGQEFPHVRARIAITALSMASDLGLQEEAFVIGILAKRLAGQAKRPDLDDEASRLLQTLEGEAGTDCLIESLQRARQLMPGAIKSRRSRKAGGVA